MGYRIVYGEDRYSGSTDVKPNQRLKTLTALLLLLFAFAVKLYWPQGVQVLQEAFLPGQPGATEQAASDFLNQVRDGVSFEDALRTFCLEILENEEQN